MGEVPSQPHTGEDPLQPHLGDDPSKLHSGDDPLQSHSVTALVAVPETALVAAHATTFVLSTAIFAVHKFTGFETRIAARDFMISLWRLGSTYGAMCFKCYEKDNLYVVRFLMKIPRGESSVSVPWVDHYLAKFNLPNSCWSIKTKKDSNWGF